MVLFAQAFVRTWSGAPLEDLTALDRRLAAAYDEGRRAWPRFDCSPHAFAGVLAARAPVDAPPTAFLDAASTADLYLVCGCLSGLGAAITSLLAHVRPAIQRALRYAPDYPEEDFAQDLYRRLFLADTGQRPRIDRYQGTGDLRAWVGVVATRMAIDRARQRGANLNMDVTVLERWAETTRGPEFQQLRDHYGPQCRAALSAALLALDTRDRNVLRYHLDGLTADQIGRIYRVHRVTIARWLSRIRYQLSEATRGALRKHLAADHRDVDSIVRLLDGEVELSIDRLLATQN